jgi:methyl-accepting chemotaxis protein
MPDDKNLRGGQDRSRIAANEDYEIRHLAEKHGVSAEEVRKAIEKVGNSREKVEEHLRSGKNKR